jgi:lysyl-tRNA synthetase class 2
LRELCLAVRGSLLLPITTRSKGAGADATAAGTTVSVDLSKPFKRISVVPELERLLDMQPGEFPDLSDPADETLRRKLIDLCHSAKIPTRSGAEDTDGDVTLSVPKLLDVLVGALIEPNLIEPTFLCHHPVCMSPLAKACAHEPTLTERFELFVGQNEICNAYTELNDPEEQMERFIMQQALRAQGGELGDDGDSRDEDTHPMSVEFCEALEYGLPPTAGWGMGVDRLVMLLTQQRSIRDVILFPAV